MPHKIRVLFVIQESEILCGELPQTVLKWVRCHYDMEHSQVADGGYYFQLCKVDTKTLNKQLWMSEKWRSYSSGFSEGLTSSDFSKKLHDRGCKGEYLDIWRRQKQESGEKSMTSS
jgi:hypothetical protein